MTNNGPRLFGIKNSNRDFKSYDTWGKNQFNSSFPAALACYMFSKDISPVYLKADNNFQSIVEYISVDKLFGISPLSNDTFYSFETQYLQYSKYIIGNLPRNDLVIQNKTTGDCVSSFEIKLTALPDNATCSLNENQYGSEIVVRPDTIIYLACSYIKSLNENQELIREIFSVGDRITDWENANEVINYIKDMVNEIRQLSLKIIDNQTPLVIQPVWKTDGKSPKLSDNCLDIFVWSNINLLNLFILSDYQEINSISRHSRTLVWLYKMLYDYMKNGQFNGREIIDKLSYNTKNDKAFSTNGSRTRVLMESKEINQPRIKKTEIKNIILGGGQNMLSPERRFDAIIFNSPDLFEEDSDASKDS